MFFFMLAPIWVYLLLFIYFTRLQQYIFRWSLSEVSFHFLVLSKGVWLIHMLLHKTIQLILWLFIVTCDCINAAITQRQIPENKSGQELNPGPLDSKPTALPLCHHTSYAFVFAQRRKQSEIYGMACSLFSKPCTQWRQFG